MSSSDRERAAYPIGAGRHANCRLNLQAFLFLNEFGGQALDPRIDSMRPNLRIADICCGTGIWLDALRHQVHEPSVLYGLDANTSNIPPAHWLPPSTRVVKYNIFDPPPADLIGTFDVINIQLAMMFIRDSAFSSVLENLLHFLKPGGWIQWTEYDVLSSKTYSPDPDYEPRWMPQMFQAIWDLFELTIPPWVRKLSEIFKEHGLNEVHSADVFDCVPSMRRAWTDVHFMGQDETEVSFLRLAGKNEQTLQRAQEFRDLTEKAYAEYQEKGVCIWIPIRRSIGRKPET